MVENEASGQELKRSLENAETLRAEKESAEIRSKELEAQSQEGRHIQEVHEDELAALKQRLSAAVSGSEEPRELTADKLRVAEALVAQLQTEKEGLQRTMSGSETRSQEGRQIQAVHEDKLSALRLEKQRLSGHVEENDPGGRRPTSLDMRTLAAASETKLRMKLANEPSYDALLSWLSTSETTWTVVLGTSEKSTSTKHVW
jgi:hypothetical protein